MSEGEAMISVDPTHAPLGAVYNFILSLRKYQECEEGSSPDTNPDGLYQGACIDSLGSTQYEQINDHRFDRSNLRSKGTEGSKKSDSCMESYR